MYVSAQPTRLPKTVALPLGSRANRSSPVMLAAVATTSLI
jgi:hypothetical protein